MGDQRHRDVDPTELKSAPQRTNFYTSCDDPVQLPERGILLEAHEIVGGDRQNDYGTPEKNWGRISKIAIALTELECLTPEVCVKVLLAVKYARMLTSPKKRDNYVDAAGYDHVLWEVVK